MGLPLKLQAASSVSLGNWCSCPTLLIVLLAPDKFHLSLSECH